MPDFANNGQGQEPSQGQSDNPIDVFNEQIPLMSEDDGLIVPSSFREENIFDDPAPPAENQAPASANPIDQSQNPAGGENPFSPEENIFKDELVEKFAEKKENSFDPDEAIKKLQEQGFVVEKKEIESEDKLEQAELQRLNSEYQSAQEFLTKSNDAIITEKLRNDLAKEYRDYGKGHLINTEEFEIEVESKFERISENETTKNMYADNIRRGIQQYAEGVKEKTKEISDKKELRFKQQLASKRKNLQGAIGGLMKTKFLGFDVNAEVANEIYQDITSGNFTKEIEANPALIAEFALYKKNREAIMQSFGGATYGEGVKAAVDAINKGGTATKSSLQQAVTGSSNAQGSISRRQAWQMPEIEDSNERKPAQEIVAGRGSY